jgi:prepilin-type N-terminal cleavage/methylation domain-containing protein
MRAKRRVLSRVGWSRNPTSPRCRAARSQGEDGFTLIELVIVVIILPILVGGMAAALIAILQDEGTTLNRLSDSADAQNASAFFARDVQNATSLTTGSPASPNTGACQNSPTYPPAGSTTLLSLQWGQTNLRTVTDGNVYDTNPYELNSTNGNFTPADSGAVVTGPGLYAGTIIIPWGSSFPPDTATNVELSSSPMPPGPYLNDTYTIAQTTNWEVTYWDVPHGSTNQLVRMFCDVQNSTSSFSSQEILSDDLPANQGPATITCGPTVAVPCTPSDLATSWIPTAGITDVSISAVEPSSGYDFDLSATPRSSNPTSEGTAGGAAAASSLLLTSTGSSILAIPGNDTLTVNGELAFNSPTGLATGQGTLNAPVGPISEYDCPPPHHSVFCPQVTAMVANCNCKSPIPMSSPLSPPTISAPTTPTTTSGPNQTGCSTTCQPGYYSGSLSLSGNVTFAPGNYLFAQSVAITGSGSVTFGAGQYTFDQGLNIGPNITVTGSGVFFYFAGTTASLTVGNSDTVELTPATSGPYLGVLAYQPPTNSATMALGAGGPPTVNTFGGAIDAPGASVDLGSDNDDFSVGSLEANNVTLGSNVTVTVGS